MKIKKDYLTKEKIQQLRDQGFSFRAIAEKHNLQLIKRNRLNQMTITKKPGTKPGSLLLSLSCLFIPN